MAILRCLIAGLCLLLSSSISQGQCLPLPYTDDFEDGVLSTLLVPSGPCGMASEAGGKLVLSHDACFGPVAVELDGTQARLCGDFEVTITFEDPNGSLDGRTEIDISRRLTLDKESTYLLNGSDVRLKDVRDVLLDTGLGTGGYSVMEQGRIDAVLSANPEARRAIFEEAAGISRFKLQKKE